MIWIRCDAWLVCSSLHVPQLDRNKINFVYQFKIGKISLYLSLFIVIIIFCWSGTVSLKGVERGTALLALNFRGVTQSECLQLIVPLVPTKIALKIQAKTQNHSRLLIYRKITRDTQNVENQVAQTLHQWMELVRIAFKFRSSISCVIFIWIATVG